MAKQLDPEKTKRTRAALLEAQAFDSKTYDYDDSVTPFSGNPLEAKTMADIVRCLESGKADIEAKVICVGQDKKAVIKSLNKSEFLESVTNENPARFKESFDGFAMDSEASSGAVGSDYIPLLGGPFNKQQYMKDFLKGHSTAFYYFHHDAAAKQVINMTKDFTLGRGYRVDFKNKGAQALWDAFSKVNKLPELMEYIALELSLYGEVLPWFLPNKETFIGYDLRPGQEIPEGALPRVRLIDPSVIWEIVTYPEDITRVLYYQWVAPTQYQMYTGKDKGSAVPSSKFIYQQIPADQVEHFKVNVVSNEKRGRSDLYPVFSYFKRLRDSLNYAVASMQKNAAWAIDTSIEGDQGDIDAYVESQEQLGTIPPAGSEFVHSTKVKREYLGGTAGTGGTFPAFEWCMSMIAMGTGWPISYFGTHMAGGQTRASAIVSTEPVAKKIEARQLVYERILHRFAERVLQPFGITERPEITFPSVIVQDSSARLADISSAQLNKWISKERAAEMGAKELNISEYNFQKEQEKIREEEAGTQPLTNPLSAPPMFKKPAPGQSPSAITSDERKGVVDAR